MTEIEEIIKDLDLDQVSKNQLKSKLEVFSEEQKDNSIKLIGGIVNYFRLFDALILLGERNDDIKASLDQVNIAKTELVELIGITSEKLK